MNLKIFKKQLLTDALDGFFTEGEALSAEITVTLPKSVENTDISGFSFCMSGSIDGILTEQELSKTVTESEITLLWSVSADFTVIPGEMSLELRGTSADGMKIIKFPSSKPIAINPKLSGTPYVEKEEIKYTNYGDIKLSACQNPPSGWLICDGSAISRAEYPKLFLAIGTLYGAGDGTSTFNLPNLKGRVSVGFDSAQTEFSVLGNTGGEKAHSLTADENGAHTHEISSYIYLDGSYLDLNASDIPCMYTTSESASSGLGTAHNNLQPYIALNYIIFSGVKA